MKVEYTTEIIKVGEGNVLVPRFTKEFELLGTFLYSDIQGEGIWFLNAIDKVLNGDSDFEEIFGNICNLEIRRDFTKVSDLLTDNVEETECKIETVQLKSLINNWICDMELLRKGEL